ncbi:MAG: hypothetical protein HYV96_03325 [Opitutae bacterium]|nr:hypothetical protein [Opitutae bacterium]
MIDFESQSVRTLLALASAQRGIDSACCALAFDHLSTAERLRCCLRNALARHRLSDLQFAILVLLFAVEPEPVPMAVLARRSGASRSAVTDAFDGLVASNLAGRDRDCRDRRIMRGRLTAAGSQKADQAINDYLRVVADSPPR